MAKKKLTVIRTIKSLKDLEKLVYQAVAEEKLPVYVYTGDGNTANISEGYSDQDTYWFLYDWGGGVDLSWEGIQMIVVERDCTIDLFPHPGLVEEKPEKPKAKRKKHVVQE